MENYLTGSFKWLIIFGICFLVNTTHAATRFWIGGSSTAWNNNANWGTASGSGAPASFPGFGDIAVFDGGGLASCVLNSNVTISTLSITAAFTQTISQGSFALVVTANSSWAGGTFLGGSGLINNGGTFNLCGTNFTSSSGMLTVTDSFSFTSGSFNHNNGTASIGVNSLSIVGSPTFYNLTLIAGYNKITFNNSLTVAGDLNLGGFSEWLVMDIAASQVLTVNGTFYMTGTNQLTINTGTLLANGDITISNTSNITGGTATVKIAGAGNQLLTGPNLVNQGCLPNVIINKPSGTLSLAGFITAIGPVWNYVSGTLSAGTSTVCFYNTAVPYTISGTQVLNKVLFHGNYSTFTINNFFTATDITLDATATCDITLTNSMTINGTLLLTGSGYFRFNTGTVNVKGDVVNNNTNVFVGGGTASFIMNGTGNQTITGTPLINQGPLPPFLINKPSGTLFLKGFVTLFNGLTWVAGTVDSGTSTCVFNNVSSAGSQSVNANPAGMSFYNIVFDQPDYLWTSLMTDLSIAGSMTITASSGIKTNGHIITLGGNFTSLNTTASGSSYVFNSSAAPVFILNGTGGQQLTMNNPAGTANKAYFANLTLNNTAARGGNDDIVLSDVLTVSNAITFTSGKMLSTATKYLSLRDGIVTTIGNASCYVNGVMRYEMAFNGNRTLNFAIGEGGNWRPVILNLSHNLGTSYTYIAQVIGSSAQALGYAMPASLSYVSFQRYTQIDRVLTSSGAANTTGLNGNQAITMLYGTNDGVTDYSQLSIAKTTGTASPWLDIGGVASANGTGSVTSTSSPSAFTGFSKFALANKSTGSNPLPIELVDFKAEHCQDRVCLQWVTASEKNSDFFTIEKSRNGFDFELVGTKPAAYNSNSLLYYTLTDSVPFTTISYYRLKQTDRDKKYNYFKIIYVTLNPPDEKPVIYPNPNGGEKFTFDTKSPALDLTLCNALGQYVTTIHLSGKTQLDLGYLDSGVYYVYNEQSGIRCKLIVSK